MHDLISYVRFLLALCAFGAFIVGCPMVWGELQHWRYKTLKKGLHEHGSLGAFLLWRVKSIVEACRKKPVDEYNKELDEFLTHDDFQAAARVMIEGATVDMYREHFKSSANWTPVPEMPQELPKFKNPWSTWDEEYVSDKAITEFLTDTNEIVKSAPNDLFDAITEMRDGIDGKPFVDPEYFPEVETPQDVIEGVDRLHNDLLGFAHGANSEILSNDPSTTSNAFSIILETEGVLDRIKEILDEELAGPA